METITLVKLVESAPTSAVSKILKTMCDNAKSQIAAFKDCESLATPSERAFYVAPTSHDKFEAIQRALSPIAAKHDAANYSIKANDLPTFLITGAESRHELALYLSSYLNTKKSMSVRSRKVLHWFDDGYCDISYGTSDYRVILCKIHEIWNNSVGISGLDIETNGASYTSVGEIAAIYETYSPASSRDVVHAYLHNKWANLYNEIAAKC